MKALAKEFKEFISKGDVMSMAVGIIIGGAFTAIVNSIVENLISPLIGMICGGIDFSGLVVKVGEASFGIGAVINSIITFLLTALLLFFILKAFNKMNEKAAAMAAKLEKEKAEEAAQEAPAEPSEDIKLLMEIRDLLKENK